MTLLAAGEALVPCGRTDPVTGKIINPCNICHFYILIHNIINFLLFKILTPLAVLAMLVGGLILLTSGGSEKSVTRGKAILTYTVIGIVLAFGAWLIINTILGNLLRPEYKPWQAFPADCINWSQVPQGSI
jgi:hypothetical protein